MKGETPVVEVQVERVNSPSPAGIWSEIGPEIDIEGGDIFGGRQRGSPHRFRCGNACPLCMCSFGGGACDAA